MTHSAAEAGEIGGPSSPSASAVWLTALVISLWDDLIQPSISFTSDAQNANIKYANTTSAIDYAHAYYPGSWNGAGSVWTDPSYNSGTNDLVHPTVGEWGWTALVHETGHTLGLNHPGNYNGGSPTYANDATYYQDSQQYTLMSYFTADNTGADWAASDGRVCSSACWRSPTAGSAPIW